MFHSKLFFDFPFKLCRAHEVLQALCVLCLTWRCYLAEQRGGFPLRTEISNILTCRIEPPQEDTSTSQSMQDVCALSE